MTDPINPTTETPTTPSEKPGSTEAPKTPAKSAAPQPDLTPAASPAETAKEGAAKDAPAKGDDAPWQDALPEGLNTDPTFRAYKDVGELAKAHANLLKLKGVDNAQILRIPAKTRDQDPEAWAAFDAARGVPADPKEYKIELAPEAAADTPELVEVLRDLGGKARFDPHQMAAVTEALNALGKKAVERDLAELKAETEATQTALKSEWGGDYDGRTRAIGKLIRDALGGQIDEAAAADLETKLGANLTVARVLGHAVAKMAEPDAPEGHGKPSGGGRNMTPTEATAALNAFHADQAKMAALLDKNHPQHKAVLQERAELLTMQRGEKRPDHPG